jgi:hypothetical protein
VPNNTKMKNHLLLLLLSVTFLFSSCEKTENNPTLGDLVAGEYKGISIVLGGTEIPLPLESGTNFLNLNFKIFRNTDITADLTLIFEEKTNGILKTEKEEHKGLILNRKPDGGISLMEDGKELAVVSGQNIEMTVVIEDLTTTFKGLKKY